MGDSNTHLLIAIIILIILSGIFSATETAYSSLNHIRLRSLADAGSKRAKQTLALAEQYEIVLSTVLVGNNIVNISLSSLATVLFISLLGSIGVTVSTVVITIVVLLFSEVTPKTLAKQAPEKFAMAVAPLMRLLLIIFKPINLFFIGWNAILRKVFRLNPEQSITEEELMTLVDEAHQEGAITQEDKDLFENVIDFNDNRVTDILTPRVDIRAISVEDSLETVTKTFLDTGFSRLPVYKENLDSIIGVLHLRDFFQLTLSGKQDFTEILTDVIRVTNTTPINRLLDQLQTEKVHMVVVVNEYGGTDGIVTMEDILEELVGNIWDEHDEIVSDIQELADGKYLVRGHAEAERVHQLFGIKDEFTSTTINGWIVEKIGHFPKENDRLQLFGLKISILKMDHYRIDECLIEGQKTTTLGDEA